MPSSLVPASHRQGFKTSKLDQRDLGVLPLFILRSSPSSAEKSPETVLCDCFTSMCNFDERHPPAKYPNLKEVILTLLDNDYLTLDALDLVCKMKCPVSYFKKNVEFKVIMV